MFDWLDKPLAQLTIKDLGIAVGTVIGGLIALGCFIAVIGSLGNSPSSSSAYSGPPKAEQPRELTPEELSKVNRSLLLSWATVVGVMILIFVLFLVIFPAVRKYLPIAAH